MTASSDEQASRAAAEAAREKSWVGSSFLRDVFLGEFRLDVIDEMSRTPSEERREFLAFYDKMKLFLSTEVDPVSIDETGEYPEHIVDGLWHNHDSLKYNVAQQVLGGRYRWIESGTMRLPYDVDALRPDAVSGSESRRDRLSHDRTTAE